MTTLSSREKKIFGFFHKWFINFNPIDAGVPAEEVSFCANLGIVQTEQIVDASVTMADKKSDKNIK